jgi:hypothetical protein
MAFVKRLEMDEKSFRSLHPTQVICRYLVSEQDGVKTLQLNTYGSDERQTPEKLSQTLQFDEKSARQLYSLLRKEFGFTE